MKLFILTTESWGNECIAEALAYLKPFNISIQTKAITFDATNPTYYEVEYSNSVKGKMETKSLKGSIIRSVAISHGGNHDYYGIIVDKSKSLETIALVGQHNGKSKTIEIYAKKKPKKKYGMNENTYNLVHEIFHALAEHYNIQDTLHDYLNAKARTLDKYRDEMLAKLKPKNTVMINDGIDSNLKGKPATNVPSEIIIHHTGGTDANILEDTSHHGFELVKSFHKSKGWDTIGYHYFIEKDGDIWQGRPDTMSGAHCIGKNKTSVGICLAGNFDFTKPTQAQMTSLKALVGHLKAKYSILNISGHRKYAQKTCPGKNFTDVMIKAL